MPTNKKKSASPQPAAKPSSRAARARAGIGDIMAGVSLTPSSAGATGSADEITTLAGRATHAARGLKHPVGSGIAFERVENIYLMDPRKIVLEGAYVRQFIEDADFHRLKASVELERDIGQHIGIRVVGPPTNQRRVLVYGMRRWKAAVAVGLEKVPVRDYGQIPEEKAVELQMLENEIRADPHPVDTALGFYLLSQQDEWSQKRIGQVFDKNKGYVSEMVRVGEAIGRLRDVDRQPLYTCPRVTVRAFQSVAQLKSVEARKDALLALLDETSTSADASAQAVSASAVSQGTDAGTAESPAPKGAEQASRRRLVDEAVFHVRPLRNGRAFRVRWTDDDLRRDGTRIAEEFRSRFLEEYQLLLHRTAVLHGGVPGHGDTLPPRIAELVAGAAHDAARVDARIGTMSGGGKQGQGGAAPNRVTRDGGGQTHAGTARAPDARE
jgi:ParB-like chromosome segregation protein Spo0J